MQWSPPLPKSQRKRHLYPKFCDSSRNAYYKAFEMSSMHGWCWVKRSCWFWVPLRYMEGPHIQAALEASQGTLFITSNITHSREITRRIPKHGNTSTKTSWPEDSASKYAPAENSSVQQQLRTLTAKGCGLKGFKNLNLSSIGSSTKLYCCASCGCWVMCHEN